MNIVVDTIVMKILLMIDIKSRHDGFGECEYRFGLPFFHSLVGFLCLGLRVNLTYGLLNGALWYKSSLLRLKLAKAQIDIRCPKGSEEFSVPTIFRTS